MDLREAKQILNKNGYELLDEGIFQGIKDRFADRKLNKVNKKVNKAINRLSKEGQTDIGGSTVDENKEFYKVATKDVPKALRGLRWGIDDEKAEEILEKYGDKYKFNFQYYVNNCTGNETKEANEENGLAFDIDGYKKGTYYSDIYRKNFFEELEKLKEDEGIDDLEELFYKLNKK